MFLSSKHIEHIAINKYWNNNKKDINNELRIK